MSRLLPLIMFGACLCATPAIAQGPFDGTWKADVASVKVNAKPERFTLGKGVYTCASCSPAYSVPADGQVHKVSGHDYFDGKMVEVLDANSVRLTNLRAGKPVAVATWTVSADGNTLNQSFSSTDTANGQTTSGTASEARLTPAPAGAHAISGSWAAAPATQLSDNALSVTIATAGKAVTVSFPTGEHFIAMLGGAYVPVVGDPSGQLVAARMTGPRTLELSYKHGSRMDEVLTLVAAPSGDTVAMTSLDKLQGGTTNLTLRKQ